MAFMNSEAENQQFLPPFAGSFVKYYFGNGNNCCHVDAVHAASPQADRFTGQIVAGIMANTCCAGIISTVSRTVADLNRPPGPANQAAVAEYRAVIRDILKNLNILTGTGDKLLAPYLHLGLHGMKDLHYGPLSMEVGTIHGHTCSLKIRKWFGETLKEKTKEIFPEVKIVFDQHWVGNPSLAAHRWGDSRRYPGYGRNYNAFQIEISRTLREKHQQEIISIFSSIVEQFKEFKEFEAFDKEFQA
ncbi:MAG TPA: hypothetical protein PKA28_13050 [Methylomusa anaerophila]|uniref:hypothetical protein n=1 Tax=Methylomusa anaerophila TaxID=1930071 RepID=UPI000F82A75E|nr:hypothetical protein [Methylomusa anaerophila]HML89361.1 hypothetical protein [Methylomusa anaerophila]